MSRARRRRAAQRAFETDRCLVDPFDGSGYRHVMKVGEDEVVRLEPFEAIELELGALWPSG